MLHFGQNVFVGYFMLWRHNVASVCVAFIVLVCFDPNIFLFHYCLKMSWIFLSFFFMFSGTLFISGFSFSLRLCCFRLCLQLHAIICTSGVMMITSYHALKLFFMAVLWYFNSIRYCCICHITTSSAHMLLFVYLESLLVLWCFYDQLLFSSLILNEVCGHAI